MKLLRKRGRYEVELTAPDLSALLSEELVRLRVTGLIEKRLHMPTGTLHLFPERGARLDGEAVRMRAEVEAAA